MALRKGQRPDEAQGAILLALVFVSLGVATAHALQYSQGRYGVTLEGFGNAAGG